jgi:hypothetical protein
MPERKMTKTTTKTLFVALLSLAATTAVGDNNQGQNTGSQGQNTGSQGQNTHYQGLSTVAAPEIDPGQAIGALALLGGTLAIIRGYRRNKK